MKESDLSPLMEGSIPQPEVNLEGYYQSQPVDIPEATVEPSLLSQPNPETPSALDTSSYQNEALEDESMWFDNTWEVMKASAEVSAGGDWFKDKLNEMGLVDVSPEVMGLQVALGADPEDVMRTYDLNYEVSHEQIEMARQAGVTPEFMPLVLRSYNNENFLWNVQKALDNQENYKTIENAPVGSQLVGSVVEFAFDPMTFAAGGATASMNFVKKAAVTGTEATLGALPSEWLKEQRTGKEAEYTQAAVGAFVFGTSVSALSDGLSAAIGTRMKARQDSLEANVDDVSRMTEGATLPDEPNAVITPQGDVISEVNPANPKVLKAAREANKGLKFMKLEDINQTVLTSPSETARTIGSDLMRSSTGLKGGGTGKEGMVADDIVSMLEGRDNMFINDFANAKDKAMKLRNNQDTEEYWREIVTAIESGRTDGLAPEDIEVMKLWSNQMVSKHEAATNPAMFGRQEAPSVFSSTRDANTYVPQVFDIGKSNMMRQRLGGSEGLHTEMKSNWKQQFDIDHNGVQAKFREMFNEVNPEVPEGVDVEELFKKFVDDYIEKKSYGISMNGDFTHSSAIEDMNYDDALVGIQNNNFALERNVFDSSFITLATDGQPFSVNDMRMFDLEDLGGMYNRRINGDIAIHGATGKTTQALKDEILQLDDKKAQKALKDYIKLVTGRSRRDPQGVWDMLGRSFMDATYASKNAMMWHMQAAEGVGFVTDRVMKLVRGGVPAVKHMLNPEAKFSKKDMADFRSAMFGKELNTRLSMSYKGVRDALVEQGNSPIVSGTVAGIRQGAAWAANKSPFTKIFNKTTETLVNMARDGVISDITDHAMLGKGKFTEETLRNASITPEQYEGILKLIKENTKVNSKGEYKANINKIIRDVRANDLWRLADYTANDQLFRTNKVSQNYTAAPNTLGMMALQFKSFMIKGVNGKFLKMAYESGNGRAVDNMLNAVLATGAASGLFAMQAHYKAQGMTESKRQKYLDEQLSWGNIVYQGFSRSSVTGSPLGVANMGLGLATGDDIFTAGRTTVVGDSSDKGYTPNASNSYRLQQDMAGRIGKQFPAFATGAGMFTAANEGRKWLWADEGYDELSHGKAFFNATRQVIPNDPMMQAFLNDLAESVGVLDTMN